MDRIYTIGKLIQASIELDEEINPECLDELLLKRDNDYVNRWKNVNTDEIRRDFPPLPSTPTHPHPLQAYTQRFPTLASTPETTKEKMLRMRELRPLIEYTLRTWQFSVCGGSPERRRDKET